jgi:hypothetical protein
MIPGIGGQGDVSFGTEHAKGRGDLKEFWHFGQYVGKIQNMLQYPENVEVRVTSFNAVGKRRTKCLKKQVFMF